MMGRHMVGSFKTADEIERFLQAWLTQYVNGNLAASGDSRARFPLVGGRVTVNEMPGRPGSFGCVIQLQPHYQLDDISAALPTRHRSQRSMSAKRHTRGSHERN